MKKAVLKLLMVMAFFVAFFVLQKVVFMLYYNSLMHDATLADHFSVICMRKGTV